MPMLYKTLNKHQLLIFICCRYLCFVDKNADTLRVLTVRKWQSQNLNPGTVITQQLKLDIMVGRIVRSLSLCNLYTYGYFYMKHFIFIYGAEDIQFGKKIVHFYILEIFFSPLFFTTYSIFQRSEYMYTQVALMLRVLNKEFP